MKILMLVNWKVKRSNEIPKDIQAPDYIVPNYKYWFFRYFEEDDIQIDVIDISSCEFLENIEKKYLHFYIVQTIKAIKRMKKYDLVISHGMPSGILLALYRKIFKTKVKHVVFDIGAFNSAKEKGKILKLNQFASKSIDGIIYHESLQIKYYEKYFPWLVGKSVFIPFGTDIEYLKNDKKDTNVGQVNSEKIVLSIGYNMRDNATLIEAFKNVKITNLKLRIIGSSKEKHSDGNIEYWPPISKRELNNQIQNAFFCILPLEYRNYSFGQMTLLQQMYYEKIIITADVPSILDYVENNKTAILYKNGNSEDLRKKIEYVYNNYNEMIKIGIEAKKSIITKYNEEIMAKKIEIFLKEVENGNT